MYWNYIHVKLKFTYKHIHVLFRFIITDLLNGQMYHDKKKLYSGNIYTRIIMYVIMKIFIYNLTWCRLLLYSIRVV